jgi:hypothetical protein
LGVVVAGVVLGMLGPFRLCASFVGAL